VASEEERAALASQLFSKANIDLLNVLNQGGDALADYIAQGKEFRAITKEATDAAAAYNDALTNLGTAAEGLKFKAFTPVIRELNQWIGVAGFAGSETDNLKAQLEDARRELSFWQENAALNPKALEESTARVKSLADALDEINQAQAASKQANEDAAAARAAEAAELAAYKKNIESLTDSFEDQAKARKAALDRETRELAAARRAQGKIEDEFKTLVQEITQPEQADVGLADVFGKINQAAAAASRGQTDAAIALARQGGDQLRQLKEKGTEADGVLKFLAERLQAVAGEAAKQETQVEIIDVEKAKQGFDLVSQRLGQLKSEAATEGQAIGRALVAGIQAEVRAADLGLPPAVQAGLASYQAMIEKTGAK
jgi:chromosome segregation ATPase